jgi:hypothetical protein
MKLGIKTKLIMLLVIIFGAVPGIQKASALVEVIEVIDGECGNGILEFGEQCDHGADNGTEGDLCLDNCEYDLTDVDQDCLDQKIQECLEGEDLPELELKPIEKGLEVLEVAPEHGWRECVEDAIEECREEPTPSPTPEPTPPVEEEGKGIDTGNPMFFEGSGGCSMTAAADAPQALAPFLALGLGVTTLLLYRREK